MKSHRGNKNSAAVVESRVAEVAAMVALSSRGNLVADCCKKWGVCTRTADGYIAAARERIAASFKADIDTEAAIAKQRLERLLEKAEARADFHAAIAAQRELIKLMGLAAPEKVEHSTSPELAEWLTLRRGNQA
jgi:hypothetical protein